MASMLLPRPDMTTATGNTSFFDDHAARAATDAANDRRGFARGIELRERRIDVRRRDHARSCRCRN